MNHDQSKQPVTAQEIRELFDYVPETGHLFWRRRASQAIAAGAIAGTVRPDGRRQVAIKGRCYLAHRLVWAFVHGQWPSAQIDHINGDPADNRIENLRDVCQSTNMENQRRAPSGKSSDAPLGAYWDECQQRWRASIVIAGKRKHIGSFLSAQEAHEAYVAEKRRSHVGCTI